MTIPAYTPPAVNEIPSTSWPRFGHWVGRIGNRPRVVQTGLDLAGIGFIVLAFSRTALSAEFLFHCVFVLLVLHAFLFGLRGTVVRIGLASIPLAIYAEAALIGLDEPPLELTEWPLMFVIAALVAWMAEKRNSTSRRYAALFRRASERLLTIEESERRRIAGEMHDNVGQVLTALTLTLDAAAVDTDIADAQQKVMTARSLADIALAGTRDLAHRIRPARLEERGLVAAVRDLAAQTGFPVVIDADRAASDRHILGDTSTVEVYRIIQEALANVMRHSGARRARVSISLRDEQLAVIVADDGTGFDVAHLPESGIGLAGMMERARLIGGHLSIESAPDAGTRVTVFVPTQSAAADR